MANTSKHERTTKIDTLWKAFHTLIELSEETGKWQASEQSVIDLANQDERVQEFKTKIGDKSLHNKSKTPESSEYRKILEAIRKYKKDFKVETNKAGKKAKSKLQSMEKMLSGNEQTIIILQETIHKLQKKLKSKDILIEELETDREKFANEISIMRKNSNHD